MVILILVQLDIPVVKKLIYLLELNLAKKVIIIHKMFTLILRVVKLNLVPVLLQLGAIWTVLAHINFMVILPLLPMVLLQQIILSKKNLIIICSAIINLHQNILCRDSLKTTILHEQFFKELFSYQRR